MFFDVQTILMQLKMKFTDYFCVKCNRMINIGCINLGLCIVAMETKFMLGVQELRS